MKKPTHVELLQLQACIAIWCSVTSTPFTRRQKSIILAIIKDRVTEVQKTCRFVLTIPGLTQGPWYFQTKAEGEKLRRWLMTNIDLTPAARVVPYSP